MSHEVSQFELQQLHAGPAAKEAKVPELRGTLSSTILHPEGEAAELRTSVKRERLCRREAERLFGQPHANHHAQTAALRDIFFQLNGEMDGFGLRPFVPHAAFNEGKLDHLVLFFWHLVAKLDNLHQQVEAAWEAEVERVATAVASCILAGIHHAAPSFPVEVVLEDLSFEDQRKMERAMADVADAVVQMEKENDFGNA